MKAYNATPHIQYKPRQSVAVHNTHTKENKDKRREKGTVKRLDMKRKNVEFYDHLYEWRDVGRSVTSHVTSRHIMSNQVKSSQVGKDQIFSPILYLYLASLPCQLGSFRLIGGGRAQRPLGTRRNRRRGRNGKVKTGEKRWGEEKKGDEGRWIEWTQRITLLHQFHFIRHEGSH